MLHYKTSASSNRNLLATEVQLLLLDVIYMYLKFYGFMNIKKSGQRKKPFVIQKQYSTQTVCSIKLDQNRRSHRIVYLLIHLETITGMYFISNCNSQQSTADSQQSTHFLRRLIGRLNPTCKRLAH